MQFNQRRAASARRVTADDGRMSPCVIDAGVTPIIAARSALSNLERGWSIMMSGRARHPADVRRTLNACIVVLPLLGDYSPSLPDCLAAVYA